MLLESERRIGLFALVKDKRSDNSAGSRLGIVQQHILFTGEIRFRGQIISASPVFKDDAGAAALILKPLLRSASLEAARSVKKIVFQIKLRKSDRFSSLFKIIEKEEEKYNLIGGECARLPHLVYRVCRVIPAVERQVFHLAPHLYGTRPEAILKPVSHLACSFIIRTGTDVCIFAFILQPVY